MSLVQRWPGCWPQHTASCAVFGGTGSHTCYVRVPFALRVCRPLGLIIRPGFGKVVAAPYSLFQHDRTGRGVSLAPLAMFVALIRVGPGIGVRASDSVRSCLRESRRSLASGDAWSASVVGSRVRAGREPRPACNVLA